MCPSAGVVPNLLWSWPGRNIVFMVPYILHPFCFCDLVRFENSVCHRFTHIYIYIYIYDRIVFNNMWYYSFPFIIFYFILFLATSKVSLLCGSMISLLCSQLDHFIYTFTGFSVFLTNAYKWIEVIKCLL